MELSAADQFLNADARNQITISSPFPLIDKPFYSPLKVTRCYRRRLIYATILILRASLWRWLKQRHNLSFSSLISNPELQSYQNADLIVDLSGDMLTEDYGPFVGYSHFLPILTAFSMGKPVVCLGQSIGPFKWLKPLAKNIFRKVDQITVRDQISYDYLIQNNLVRNDNLSLTADLAFLLPMILPQQVSQLLADNRVTKSTTPILGISVSQLVGQHYKRRNPNSQSMNFIDLIATIADRCHRELKMQILFIPHVTGPKTIGDDRIIARQITDRMEFAATCIEGDYRPDELKGIISQCAFFLGARMHANIAALCSHIPVTAISYSHKTDGIMAEVGLEDYVLPIEKISIPSAMKMLHRMIENSKTTNKKLSEAIPRIQDGARKNTKIAMQISKYSSQERA